MKEVKMIKYTKCGAIYGECDNCDYEEHIEFEGSPIIRRFSRNFVLWVGFLIKSMVSGRTSAVKDAPTNITTKSEERENVKCLSKLKISRHMVGKPL